MYPISRVQISNLSLIFENFDQNTRSKHSKTFTYIFLTKNHVEMKENNKNVKWSWHIYK